MTRDVEINKCTIVVYVQELYKDIFYMRYKIYVWSKKYEEYLFEVLMRLKYLE